MKFIYGPYDGLEHDDPAVPTAFLKKQAPKTKFTPMRDLMLAEVQRREQTGVHIEYQPAAVNTLRIMCPNCNHTISYREEV